MFSVSDLFTSAGPSVPLAEQLRPHTLEQVIGQRHLLAPGKPLRLAFDSGKLHSMILWGPPGVGKTTLARLITQAIDAEYIALSAVFSGVKDIREAIGQAQLNAQQFSRHTILFVDEVHRFNKAQQDAFLPYVEQGVITFIGATTENPSFEVNGALLSRAQVYVLYALSAAELEQLFDQATAKALPGIEFTGDARSLLTSYADGDARRLINLLEQVRDAAPTHGVRLIDGEFIKHSLVRGAHLFDKGGDAFYDQISAFHKSMRGSEPDAALYWLCRLLDGGADPRYLGRRMIRMATEDIGLADPRALRLALDAMETYERLGSPEGELTLAQACVYLACAPKSNAVYLAYNSARKWVKDNASWPVPLHLRNAPTQLMKSLDYGRQYRYAHDEPAAYAAGENYFPDGMARVEFYRPTPRGLEGKIQERLAHLRTLDARAKDRKK